MNDSIWFWNQVAMDTGRADFSSPDPAIAPSPQQPGPTYMARALAIVHLAMYDAYAGVRGTDLTYLDYSADPPPAATSVRAARAAVAAAACLTLIELFNRQKTTLLSTQARYLVDLGAGGASDVAAGLAWGRRVAQRMLAERRNDGSDAANDQYNPSPEPFAHRPDPLNPAQGYLGPLWGQVKPFGFQNLRRSIKPLPDPVGLAEYEPDFTEVFTVGRDRGGSRTADQALIGLFWGYDSARNLGVPIFLYNQAVRSMVATVEAGIPEPVKARLFAMVHVGMADAGIQAWYEKYRYNLWRPVVGIREADPGFGPTGAGDGKFDGKAHGDPFWQPLGAQRTNSGGAPFTPNFPSYPSGHATFGTAALLIAQQVLGFDPAATFELESGELDGESAGATGVRPRYRRTYTVDQAITDNVLSRVYLGVHWKFDGLMGKQIGSEIAGKVVASFPARS